MSTHKHYEWVRRREGKQNLWCWCDTRWSQPTGKELISNEEWEIYLWLVECCAILPAMLLGYSQGLKCSGNDGNAVPTRNFDVLVVGTYIPSRRKGLAKFTGALNTNDVSILGLFNKRQTVVSVANSQTFEDQTLQFFLSGLLRFDIFVF